MQVLEKIRQVVTGGTRTEQERSPHPKLGIAKRTFFQICGLGDKTVPATAHLKAAEVDAICRVVDESHAAAADEINAAMQRANRRRGLLPIAKRNIERFIGPLAVATAGEMTVEELEHVIDAAAKADAAVREVAQPIATACAARIPPPPPAPRQKTSEQVKLEFTIKKLEQDAFQAARRKQAFEAPGYPGGTPESRKLHIQKCDETIAHCEKRLKVLRAELAKFQE